MKFEIKHSEFSVIFNGIFNGIFHVLAVHLELFLVPYFGGIFGDIVDSLEPEGCKYYGFKHRCLIISILFDKRCN